LQPYWNAPLDSAFEYIADDIGANAATLKGRVDDKFAKIDMTVSVFDTAVATTDTIRIAADRTAKGFIDG